MPLNEGRFDFVLLKAIKVIHCSLATFTDCSYIWAVNYESRTSLKINGLTRVTLFPLILGLASFDKTPSVSQNFVIRKNLLESFALLNCL